MIIILCKKSQQITRWYRDHVWYGHRYLNDEIDGWINKENIILEYYETSFKGSTLLDDIMWYMIEDIFEEYKGWLKKII